MVEELSICKVTSLARVHRVRCALANSHLGAVLPSPPRAAARQGQQRLHCGGCRRTGWRGRFCPGLALSGGVDVGEERNGDGEGRGCATQASGDGNSCRKRRHLG